jgi:hypothetical protein
MPIAVGQLSIADLNDVNIATLTSEAGFVSVNEFGVAISPVSYSTTMNVYKGNVQQSGWAFSRSQSGLTSAINSSTGILAVTAISSDVGYADITATKSGESSLVKRFTLTKVYQGASGEDVDPELVESIQGDLLDLGNQLQEQAADLLSLEGVTEGHTASISSNTSGIVSLAARVSTAEGTISNQVTSITQNADEVASVATRMTAAEGSITNHTSAITQNAEAISLRVEAVDTDGNGIAGARIEVSTVDGAGQITLDADKILLDGSVKAGKIDATDLTVNNVISTVYEEGVTGFELKADGTLNAVNAVFNNMTAIGGTFTGSVTHPSFETVIESSAGSAISIPAKTKWKADTLYDALSSISVSTSLQTVVGTFGGETINAATRLSSTGRVILASNSRDVEELYGETLIFTFTVPQDCTQLYYNFVVDFPNGSYCYVTITKNATGYNNNKIVSISTASMNDETISGYTSNFVAGDVLRFYTYRTTVDTTARLESASYDKGTILRKSDGSLTYLRYGGFYSTALSITSPNTFTSSNDYVLCSSIANAFSDYGSGGTYKASGTVSVSGTSKTVSNIMRTDSNFSMYFSTGDSLTMVANDTDGATTGCYNVSGSISVTAQEAGIFVKSIFPMVDATSSTTTGGTDIGMVSNKVRNIIGAGNISGFSSISGTTITGTNVWGAVFN